MNSVVPAYEANRYRGREDSVKARLQQEGKKYSRTYERARDVFYSMAPYQRDRARNYRYVFSDQWGDLVKDDNGKWVRERERISARTGGVVLQNNHLFKIVNALVGTYAKSPTMPICYARQSDADQKSQMMTNALQANWDNNQMKELMLEARKELIIGGLIALKEEWGVHDGVEDSYSYYVDPSKFFMEVGSGDPRFWGLSLVGEIRDWTIGQLAARLAHSNYDYRQLEHIYHPYINEVIGRKQLNTSEWENQSWEASSIEAPCRTYEIWTFEHKPRYRCKDLLDMHDPVYRIEEEDLPKIKAINAQRAAQARAAGVKPVLIEYKYIIDQYWHCQILGPEGIILDEFDSPYDHKSHPYTIQAYNWVNGDIVPYISVIIDQQRYINRLITLHDLAISASIKGVKMIPTTVVPKGMSYREFAKRFVEIDGFIFYEPDENGAKPEVITVNATNIGTADLLQLEIGFINDLSSVSEALQGKAPSAGTSAARYMMESENSSVTLAGLDTKFNAFETGVAKKKMKVIHQYYTEPRNISMQRSGGYSYYETYRPQDVQDIDFDCKVSQTHETPIGRMMVNELLESLEQMQAISPLDRLRFGYYPGTEALRQEMESRQERSENAGVGMEQQAQQANPATVNMLRSILGKPNMAA